MIGHEKIVELLLRHGADVYHQDYDGNTAYHRAAENKHHHIMQLLLDLSNERNRLENICNKKGLKAADIAK